MGAASATHPPPRRAVICTLVTLVAATDGEGVIRREDQRPSDSTRQAAHFPLEIDEKGAVSKGVASIDKARAVFEAFAQPAHLEPTDHAEHEPTEQEPAKHEPHDTKPPQPESRQSAIGNCISGRKAERAERIAQDIFQVDFGHFEPNQQRQPSLGLGLEASQPADPTF